MTLLLNFAFPLLLAVSAVAQTEPLHADAAKADTQGLPPTTLLWEGRAPGSQGDADEDRPALTYFAPDEGTSIPTAVLICPGGGYRTLAMNHEGYDVARWLNQRGIHAFVLKYRLGPKYHHPVELQDVARAMRLARWRAAQHGFQKTALGSGAFQRAVTWRRP